MTGTMRLDPSLAGLPLVDPLARLPEPPDDLNLFRTYPGRPDRGAVTWEVRPDGVIAFTADLPRRWGTIGATRHGLFASGGWYPQVLVQDEVPVVGWDVTVHLPDAAGGALGTVAGEGTLAWSGLAERAPLAVVPRPRFAALADDVTLVTRGRPRRVLVRELEEGLARATPMQVELVGAVVEAPLRRRLTGSSPGLAYVSDRAYRLTPGFQRYHRVAVVRGVTGALLGEADPFERDLAAAALGAVYAEGLKGPGADGLLRVVSWIPQIQSVLASERMAFYAEVLERTFPSDPVRDDLMEVLDPFTPGTVVHAQLDDAYGEDTAERLGLRLARGEGLEEAALAEGVPLRWLAQWRRPYPVQDYVLDVVDGSWTVTRDAQPDAPSEVLTLAVGGERVVLDAIPPGATVSGDATGPVRLDPQGHVGQTSRFRDTWPARYTVTLAAGIDAINVTRGQLSLSGMMTLRRQYDTRNLWFGSAYTSPGTLVGARLSWLRKVGALQDGWTRPLRVTLGGGVALLNPDFANVDVVRPSLSSSVGVAWDSRVSNEFPLRGRRLFTSVGGGFIPEIDERWGSVSAGAVGLVPLHPRHVLAGRAEVTAAASNVAWRLLSLAGTGAMRSLPQLPACGYDEAEDGACAETADLRAVGAWEYRVAPLRQASVPLLLAWGTELQLTAGAEGVVARVDGEPAAAVGVTAGVGGVGDILGADASAIGVTAGWPVWWTGLDQVEATAIPELYLRFSQAF